MKMELLLIIITQDAYIGQRFTKRSSYLCGIYDKTANTMKEPFQIPTSKDIENLIGTDLYDVWNSLCQRIEKSYEMELLWNRGGKAWTYEYKYRKGGKTLCALYAKEKTLGFMVILGKDERLKFAKDRENYSKEVQKIYDETPTYHDGKWLMFTPVDISLFEDFLRLLTIKRKPNKK